MTYIVTIPQAVERTVRAHLFQNGLEQGGFLFARPVDLPDQIRMEAVDAYLVPPEGWESQLEVYLEMTDAERAKIMKLARDRGLAIVDCHSHPDSDRNVRFSPSDRQGITDFAAYAKWKLNGRPYTAMVWGETSMDAVAWYGDFAEAQRVDEIRILADPPQSGRPGVRGFTTHALTGGRKMETNRYARQVLAFGEEGQLKLRTACVGVVGLGGIGSQVVQALAYLGVGSFVLADDDVVEETNLNRLVGAVPSDVEARTPKAAVAKRLVGAVNPEAVVRSIPRNLRSRGVLGALIGCPLIFGCVDHDAPRLILSELAAAYDLVLLDAATEISRDGTTLTQFGGRVVVARPGDYCLDCAGQLDMERAKWELATPETREISKRHGYGLGEDAPSPAVISLNGVVANLTVTEFLVMVTNIREPNRHLTYHALQGKVNIRTDRRRDDCYICNGLAGVHERVNIFRYALDDDHDLASETTNAVPSSEKKP